MFRSLGRLTSKLRESRVDMEEEGREEEGRKGKEKVVELCKECAIGNEDDDDNDEQG